MSKEKKEKGVIEQEFVFNPEKDCPLCNGDNASLADFRVIACPVDHTTGLSSET